MGASDTKSGTSSTLALEGVKVYASHRISHRTAKVERWRRLLPGLGAQLVEDVSSVVTHVVENDSKSDQDKKLMNKACHVTVEWLEQCLALQKRLPEKNAGHFSQTQHTAKAEAKPVEHPAVEQSEVQRALLCVTAGDPPPKWMNTQKGGIACSDYDATWLRSAAVSETTGQKLLPEMAKCLGNPVPLKAKHVSVHPMQASRSFLTVTASALPTSKKRKRETSASDLPCIGSAMPAATNTAGAGSLPTNTCTAAPSANAVSTSNSGKASVADTAECASQADALATSSSTIGPPDAAAAAAAGAPPFPLEHYVLAYTQMQAANYPLPAMSDSGQKVLPLGFVASYESGEQGSQHQRMVAVDCEMCYTRTALELTRLTLVNENEQVLLDELVLPDTPIVNYNTSFSGISPAMMKGVTTTLAQIQQRILQYVGPDTFLVGHSLENDLRVMKLVHLKNLDTAVMYPAARWPVQQNSLRWLADHYLKQTIQRGAHDSKEDAIAALRLVHLKLQHGPFFGKSNVAEVHNLVDVVHEQDRKCVMLDRPEVLAWHASSTCKTLACLSDEQAVTQARQCAQEGSADVIWLQLWTLADLYENRAYHQRARQKWPYPKEAVLQKSGKGSIEECLHVIDAQVKQVYDALQPGSMLLVVTSQGDTTHQRLKEERAKEVRQAKQLAEATSTKFPGYGSGHHSRDSVTPGNTLCFCAIK